MTFQNKIKNLIDLIDEDNKSLKEEINNKNEEVLSICRKIIQANKKQDRKALTTITPYELVLVCMSISDDTSTTKEIKDKCNLLKPSIDSLKAEPTTIENLINLIKAIDNKNSKEITHYIKKLNLTIIEEQNIIKEDDYSVIFKPLYYLLIYKFSYINIEKMPPSKMKKFLHDNNYDQTIKTVVYFVQEYYDCILKQDEDNKRIIDINKELKRKLENKQVEDLLPIKEDYLDYLSKEVLDALFILIGEILNVTYNDVKKEVDTIQNSVNESPLTYYLYLKGIEPSTIDEELYIQISNIDFELFKKRFDFLCLLKLQPKEIINSYNYYIFNLNPDIIDEITFYIDSNIISKKYIRNRISEISTIFSKIKTNYEILKPIMDFNNIYYNESILLEDLTTIKNRLSILSEYNLMKTNYIFLLCNFNYINIYDLMLENDIPLYLLINICNTLNPELTIKRIMLFKELNIPYITPTHQLIKEVKEEKYFVCSNEEINNIYPTNLLDIQPIQGETITTIKDDDYIKKLDEQYRIDDTYLIGDTVISRPKLLKNLQYIKDNEIENNNTKLSSFLSNSIYTSSSILDIKEELNIEKSYLI